MTTDRLAARFARPVRPARPAALAACLLAVSGAALGAFAPAAALPLYATRNGLACATCHFDPNGGGPRNSFGFLYSRNRHEMAAPDSGRWASLPLSNKIGEALTFGTNLRTQYMYLRTVGSGAPEVSTIFPMQGALYVVFEPHPNLTVVYNRDLHQSRDAYGMIHGLPGGLYVKAGQIRVPFGLRQDDHTSAMRAGFRDAATNPFGTSGFTPFDPRDVEGGLETGFSLFPGGAGVIALTNGGSVFATHAQAVTAKVTYFGSRYLGGLSGYDNYQSDTRRRASRISYYGGVSLSPRLQLVGEVGAGTDDTADGVKHNLRGYFAEADYRVCRTVLTRAKYDFIDLDHSVPGRAQKRYSLESDFTLVPFADLKAAFRRVVPDDANDEDQLLLQFHFYY